MTKKQIAVIATIIAVAIILPSTYLSNTPAAPTDNQTTPTPLTPTLTPTATATPQPQQTGSFTVTINTDPTLEVYSDEALTQPLTQWKGTIQQANNIANLTIWIRNTDKWPTGIGLNQESVGAIHIEWLSGPTAKINPQDVKQTTLRLYNMTPETPNLTYEVTITAITPRY